jgi:hypothetical protein
MSMTDTQLLDFCEAVMESAKNDSRYPLSYNFMLGNMTFVISRRQTNLREMLEAEFQKRVIARLLK